MVRDRDGQGSRLTQGISPNRNYGSNTAQQRKPVNRMIGNNNYVDRAERIELINGRNRDNHHLDAQAMRRNGSEQRFSNPYGQKKNGYNQSTLQGLPKGSAAHLPTALQNQYLLNNQGTQSSKNLQSRSNQAQSVNRQLAQAYASKKATPYQKNNRNNSKFDRNVSNAKAYLNNQL